MAVEIKGDTRIFSPDTVPGLCVTIGRQLNESRRLTALQAARFCRFEHIVPNSSGKVVAKFMAACRILMLPRPGVPSMLRTTPEYFQLIDRNSSVRMATIEIKDIAGLSKPLKKLIEAIAEGIGGVSRPVFTPLNANGKVYEIHTMADVCRKRGLVRIQTNTESARC